MIDYIVGRNLGHLSRCVANVSKFMTISSKPLQIHAFPPTHEWIRRNLPESKIRSFSGHRVKNQIGSFLKHNLIVHDWREEVRLLKESRQRSGPIIAGIYHSELSVTPIDTQLTRKFKKQIREISQKTTDIFFHINLTQPGQMPKLDVFYVPIPLIARDITLTPDEVKDILGIPHDEPFILVQMGGGIGKYRYKFMKEWYEKINKLKIPCRIVIANQLKDNDYSFNNHIIRAPLFDNGRDLVNAASMVISKPGMGILMDCVSTCTPLLALPADTKERLVKNMMLFELVENDVCLASNKFSAKDLARRIEEIFQHSQHFERAFKKIPSTGAEVIARSMKLLAGGSLEELPDLYEKILAFTPFRVK